MKPRTIRIAVVVASLAAAAIGTVPASAARSARPISAAPAAGDQLLRSDLQGNSRLRSATPQARAATTTGSSSLSQCNSSWSTVATQTASSDAFLLATAARSAQDQWAVGGAYQSGSSVEQNHVQHWDGNAWTVSASPNAGSLDNELEGVASFAANDATSVGVQEIGVDASNRRIWQTLAQQWNGSSWSTVPTANLTTSSNVLNGVVRTSATDGWAAGWYAQSAGPVQTLIERWNGSSWSVVTSPNLAAGNNELFGLTARSATDVWTVGFYQPVVGGTRLTLIEHWDGVSWTVVTSPDAGIGNNNVLYQVSASPAGDLWAVGYWTNSLGVAQALTEHYAAGVWSVMTSANFSAGNNTLFGVAAISANDVWAVGDYTNDYPATSNSTFQGITEHWDGNAWTVSYGLNYYTSDLNAVVALSHSDVWAVGDQEPSSGAPFRPVAVNNCTPPTISSLTPNTGPAPGGTSVTITGTGFDWATGVNFGAAAATGVTVNSDTQITATSPSGRAGVTDVRIAYFAGQSAATAADQFTYTATVPLAPTSVVAIPGDGQMTLYWSAPASDGGITLTSYTITPYIGAVAQTPITLTGSPPPTTLVVSGLTNGTLYTFTVTATNSLGSGPPSAPSSAAAPGRGHYHPLPPARILDTRSGLGAPASPLGPGGTITVQITGVGGVPSSGVAAVVVNATVTGTTSGSFLTVWPAGVQRPLASNLNWTAGKTVPNLVSVAVGEGGKVAIYNALGSTDVIFDVAGYMATTGGSPTADGLYTPVVPNRVLDTRNGTGGVPAQPVGAGQTINVRVAGTPNIPSTGVAAVVLNVTVTGATSGSYLTVFPTGTSTPVASNLNFVAGQTVPNRVIVKVGTNTTAGTGGWVSFYNALGSVHVIADVGGWFTDASNPAATGSTFIGLTPARILDTRDGTGGITGPITAGQTIAATVAGRGGVPAMNATVPPTAVVLNVTVTNTTAASFLTAWPSGATRPNASDLNWVSGLTVPNLVVVKVGSDGKVNLFSPVGSTNVIIDVVGWYG